MGKKLRGRRWVGMKSKSTGRRVFVRAVLKKLSNDKVEHENSVNFCIAKMMHCSYTNSVGIDEGTGMVILANVAMYMWATL